MTVTVAMPMTPPEVAAALRVNVRKVLAWIGNGSLTATNVGAAIRPRWRIDPADLEAFKLRKSNQATAKPATQRRPRRQSTTRDYFPD